MLDLSSEISDIIGNMRIISGNWQAVLAAGILVKNPNKILCLLMVSKMGVDLFFYETTTMGY